MAWEETKLEQLFKTKLSDEISATETQDLTANYEAARSAVITNVAPHIEGQEPGLTDHGPKHIADVMDNVYRLIDGTDLEGLSIFVLAVATLYHDVGNIFGRKKHNQTLLKVLDKTYPKTGKEYDGIKSLVNSIAGAHTGLTPNGSRDTLKELSSDQAFLKDEINPRELAAVLRFADELAEGQHRTSNFLIENGLINPDSQIYHVYASCCEPAMIDISRGRIALTYRINIQEKDGTLIVFNTSTELTELLEFILNRIIKVDTERKYCKHYAHKLLSKFVSVSASFEFWFEEINQLQFEGSPLIMDDLVDLDSPQDTMDRINRNFSPDSIVNQLQAQLND